MDSSTGKSPLRVLINGMGRVGRRVFRQGFDSLNIVAVNSRSSVSDTAYFLQYDSVHGPWKKRILTENNRWSIKGRETICFKENRPEDIPFELCPVDIVIECSGRFKQAQFWEKAFSQGVKTVLVSAPAQPVDMTLVYGINHRSFDKTKHRFISAASCTSNCLAPLLQVLKNTCGIKTGLFSTVHSYTNDQRLLDSSHTKDLRRARAAALNIIPTETGADRALQSVFPEIAPRLKGIAFRVPTANVSLLDLTVETERKTSLNEIQEAFCKASASQLKGILAVEKKALVSSDFTGRTESAILDLPLIRLEGGRLLKLAAWYDNEAGFSQRLIDFVRYMD